MTLGSGAGTPGRASRRARSSTKGFAAKDAAGIFHSVTVIPPCAAGVDGLAAAAWLGHTAVGSGVCSAPGATWSQSCKYLLKKC